MKKAIMATACLLLASCSFAGMEAKRAGRYHVNGYTTNPEAAVRAVSDAYVQETYADAYRDAVQNGMAYPYAGGAVGNDYQFYYQGVMPPAPAGGQQQVAPAQDGDAQHAQETADEALRRANDSLRMHKKLKQELSGSEQGRQR